jgi:hypothetical protein
MVEQHWTEVDRTKETRGPHCVKLADGRKQKIVDFQGINDELDHPTTTRLSD